MNGRNVSGFEWFPWETENHSLCFGAGIGIQASLKN